MKGGVRKKEYSIFTRSNFIVLPILGWYFGGAILLVVGVCLAIAIDVLFPKWKWELTWQDIDRALKNIYRYGSNPCELCILVEHRKIFVYRDERGDPDDCGGVRMAVRIPLKDWADLYNKNELSELMHRYGYMGMYSKNRGPEAYVLYSKDGPNDCKRILKEMFEKSVDGLRPDIYAKSVVNSKKNIWFDHSRA